MHVEGLRQSEVRVIHGSVGQEERHGYNWTESVDFADGYKHDGDNRHHGQRVHRHSVRSPLKEQNSFHLKNAPDEGFVS